MRQGEPAQVLEVFGDDHVVNGLIALGWPPPAGPGFPRVATELGVGRAVMERGKRMRPWPSWVTCPTRREALPVSEAVAPLA
jgi:hypothetical protein